MIICAFFAILWIPFDSLGEPCYTPNNVQGVCVILPQCPNLVQWYGANPGNQQVINYLIGSQRNCGTRSIRRNPLVCCDRPLSSTIPQPDNQPPVTQAPENTAPWLQTPRTPQPQPPTQPPTPAPTPPPTVRPTSSRFEEEQCSDPNGSPGTCRSIRECPHILEQFVARQNDPSYRSYIQQSNSLCNYVQPNICCTRQTPPTEAPAVIPTPAALKGRLLTPDKGCGFSNTTLTRVVGGQPAKKGLWSPRMRCWLERIFDFLLFETT